MASEDQARLIQSYRRLFVVFLLLAFAFGYFSSRQIDTNNYRQALDVLDKLLILRGAIVSGFEDAVPLSHRDLMKFSNNAQREYLDTQHRYMKTQRRLAEQGDAEIDLEAETALGAFELIRAKFSEEIIADASLVGPIPSRFSSRLQCQLAAYSGTDETQVYVMTARGEAMVDRVSADHAFVINFDRGCIPGYGRNYGAFLVETEKGWLIGVPRPVVSSVATLRAPDWYTIGPFENAAAIVAHIPEGTRKYIDVEQSYELFGKTAIEVAIIQLAQYKTGTFYSLIEFDQAVSALFKSEERTAMLLGLSVENLFFLRACPIVAFALTYAMWRRIRRIEPEQAQSEPAWILTDLNDVFGKVISVIYAFLPLVLGILVYGLFAYSQQLGLIVFGRIILIEHALDLELPAIAPPGWRTWDRWASIIMMLFVIQLGILVAITRKSLQIVLYNAGVCFQNIRDAIRHWIS